MKNVFLITKLRTTNVGNQALSEELIKLFMHEVSEHSLCVYGRPMGLDGYIRARIEFEHDPIARFEEWADDIIKHFKKHHQNETRFYGNVSHVELIGLTQPKLRFESIKARLRPVKRFLSRFIAYNRPYKKRLEIINSSDWLVYSGAGEVVDNNVFLRQLLEIRVAQKLGKKTAAINQSVVIKTPCFKKLVGHVYGKMDKVVVRGEISIKNLRSYGVSSSILSIAPDTALKTTVSKKENLLVNEGLSKPLVGINFTPYVKLNLIHLGKIIETIRSTNKSVVFITNEPYEDRKIAEMIRQKFEVPYLNTCYPYEEFSRVLGDLEYLISTRLHSNILALVAKTPVIPIEGNVFKTTELLKQLEYPMGVVNSSGNDWMLGILEEIRRMENGEYDWKNYFDVLLPQYIVRVSDNTSWLKEI